MGRIQPIALLITLLLIAASCGRVDPPEPFGACPTPAQVRWQQMEMNMFCHFGPNTFTDREWGDGAESESLFNPTALDCRQWAAVARQGGMKGIIITAKHHDGFCLWPNPHSRHTVAQSPWREGHGDVLEELSAACHDAGLAMGVYVSPWDRHDPSYGSPAYNNVFKNTIEDILSRYGEIFEQWFDGANGEGPNGKRQQYDWPLFNATVTRLQPEALIFSDVGPGCRWVGNESGEAAATCWSTLDSEGYSPGAGSPPIDTLRHGNRRGSQWIPAEADVSIRPGWFWHADEHPKTLQELLSIYYHSVGRNALLLLNVPPDSRGLIPDEDSLRLTELRHAIDAIFAHDLAQHATAKASHQRGGRRCKKFSPQNVTDNNYDSFWTVDDTTLSPTLTLSFDKPVTFNRILLQEYIPLGQRVERFHIDILDMKGNWHTIADATTIGYKRILLTATTTATALRMHIDESLACPVVNRLSLYMDTIYKTNELDITNKKY